jgi:hypothetical protein
MLSFLQSPLRAVPDAAQALRNYAGLPPRDDAAPERFASWLPYLAFMENGLALRWKPCRNRARTNRWSRF